MEYGEYLAHMNMRRKKPKKDEVDNDTSKNTQSRRPSRSQIANRVVNETSKRIRTGIESAENSAAARDKIAYERKKHIRNKTEAAVQKAVEDSRTRRQQRDDEKKKKRERAVKNLRNLLKGVKRV